MQIVVRARSLTTYVFGIVENFVAELYAGTRGIPSGFFIIRVVLFTFVGGTSGFYLSWRNKWDPLITVEEEVGRSSRTLVLAQVLSF